MDRGSLSLGVVLAVACVSSAAGAQEGADRRGDTPGLSAANPLPRTLAGEEPAAGGEKAESFAEGAQAEPPRLGFSLGPRAGYLRARDADRGTWFGGLQARVRLSQAFCVEGSIEFHRDEFADGSVEVTQYPVQATALLYPFPEGPLQVYVLAGAGAYFTHLRFEEELEGLDDETERVWGIHVGAGAELFSGNVFSLDVDLRYIFLDESGNVSGARFGELDEDEMDFWQITVALNFFF